MTNKNRLGAPFWALIDQDVSPAAARVFNKLRRLAQREGLSIRLTFHPNQDDEEPSPVWDLTLKPRAGASVRIRHHTPSDHVHYPGLDFRKVVEDALSFHDIDFEQIAEEGT